MITPSFGLTATERVLPKLALDFTTAILDSRITFTRSGNTATYTNSSGIITAINANLPRFDYNPTTLICQGLLIEEARTNILVNSLINGTNLSTQSVATTAVVYTLSFYGTGNIVLSGTSTGTVTGTGVYPSRKTFTFTPTAGTLTLTVSGTVQYAQLEVGSFATSFIPTTTAQTRNADVATMTGTNFSSWYNASEGALVVSAITPPANTDSSYNTIAASFSLTANPTSSFMALAWAPSQFSYYVRNSGTFVVNTTVTGTVAANTTYKNAFAYKTDSYAASVNGNTVAVDNAGTLPTFDRFDIGSRPGGAGYFVGIIKSIYYYPQRLTNSQIQAFSK